MDYNHAKKMRDAAQADAINRLLGLCTGIIADGVICQTELDFLRTWLLDNQTISQHWPANVINQHIQQIVSDGQVTPDELASLLEALQAITGTAFAETGSAAPSDSSTPNDRRLILSSDLPAMPTQAVMFDNNLFCFSGKFIFGSKAQCEEVTKRQGASVAQDITQTVDYLVVGAIPAGTWKFGSYGRKIENAARWHAQNGKPYILSEEAWTSALG